MEPTLVYRVPKQAEIHRKILLQKNKTKQTSKQAQIETKKLRCKIMYSVCLDAI